jgi:SAM-dependent methyltransferase
MMDLPASGDDGVRMDQSGARDIDHMTESYLMANRKLWNTRTPLHVKSDFYNVAAFRAGGSSLCGIETAEMGSVREKSILHLQCHFGLDTLSLARLGAVVTGVDFSDASIAVARSLANELKIPAKFVCCNVLELPDHLDDTFDVVFTSFGVLGWLPDLEEWASVIRDYLKPDGFLYVLEFDRHFIQLNDQGEITYNYFFSDQPDQDVTSTTYADGARHAPHTEYWWNHSMSDIVSAVLKAGLQITLFHEFPYSAYKISDAMIETAPGKWVHERLRGKIPYMFSLRATKTYSTFVSYGK